jgi:signal transduction histidine kinase
MSDASIEAKLARLEELEQRFAEAVERAKLEAMKELGYGAGHEVNNPLANIATRAQTLLHEQATAGSGQFRSQKRFPRWSGRSISRSQ